MKKKRKIKNHRQSKDDLCKPANTIIPVDDTFLYESQFIRQADAVGRKQKSIYVRRKYYDRIHAIITLYDNPRLSVFAYVDAVLEQHFEMYKKEIKEIHDKLYKAPYDE